MQQKESDDLVGSEQVDSPMAFDIELFKDFSELRNYQEEWDNFIEEVNGAIFLTYDWCRTWWNYYGEKRKLLIFIVRIRSSGRICAILPLFYEKIWLGPVYARVIKMVSSDFSTNSIYIPVVPEFLKQTMKMLLRKLADIRLKFDILLLGPISGNYPSFEELLTSCREAALERNMRVTHRQIDVQTYFKVEKSWEEQLANFTKKQRSNMRRKYERLLKEGATIQCIPANENNFGKLFDNFVKMHQTHWQKLGRPGHFVAWPYAYDFHKEVASEQLAKKRLRLYEIRVNNECIGYSYAYRFGPVYYRFLFARAGGEVASKYDFAKIDFAEMVKRALKENVTLMDSMQSKYKFKMHLGGKLLPIRNILIFQNSPLALLRITIFRGLVTVVNICYSKVWRSRVAPSLGLSKRPYWKMWLRTYILSF